jgi:hypothetical protein
MILTDPSSFSCHPALTRKHVEKKIFSPPFEIQIPRLDEEIMDSEKGDWCDLQRAFRFWIVLARGGRTRSL